MLYRNLYTVTVLLFLLFFYYYVPVIMKILIMKKYDILKGLISTEIYIRWREYVLPERFESEKTSSHPNTKVVAARNHCPHTQKAPGLLVTVPVCATPGVTIITFRQSPADWMMLSQREQLPSPTRARSAGASCSRCAGESDCAEMLMLIVKKEKTGVSPSTSSHCVAYRGNCAGRSAAFFKPCEWMEH